MYDLFQRLYYFFLERQQLICLQYFTSMIHLLNHEQSYYNTEHMQVFFTFGKIKFDINTRYFLSAISAALSSPVDLYPNSGRKFLNSVSVRGQR